MKNKLHLIAGSAFLLVAFVVTAGKCAGPATAKEPAATASQYPEFSERRHAARQDRLQESRVKSRATRVNDAGAAASIAQWGDRLRDLETKLGGHETAVPVLLDEVAKSYASKVRDAVLGFENLPAIKRHELLIELESYVGRETAAILNQLGIDGEQHLKVTAAATQPVWAELLYADAAPDPASRLTLLRLDRERVSRMHVALAMNDEAARDQALADLGGWYEAELKSIINIPRRP